MHHICRTLLLSLALTLACAGTPMSALAGDALPSSAAATGPAARPAAEVLRDRLFVLEHELHALEAERMALRERLAALESRAGE